MAVFFSRVHTAPTSTHSTLAVARTARYNWINSVMHDIVSIGTGTADDQVTIRFFTDNPGLLFHHCDIDWHLDAYAFFGFNC